MYKLALLISVPVAIAVWYYNYWAIGCGRCSYSDFWRIGPHTMLWGGFIVAVFGILLYMRHRNKRACECPQCKRVLDTVWTYCPDCGIRGR